LRDNITKEINYSVCIGDGYEILIYNTIYSEDNATGEEIVVSNIAYDTLVHVNFDFNLPDTTFEILEYVIFSAYLLTFFQPSQSLLLLHLLVELSI